MDPLNVALFDCALAELASAASVQALIISLLVHEFFERRSPCARLLQFQLKSERRENIGNLGIAEFAQATVLQRVECGESDPGFLGEGELGQTQRFALHGDLLA